MAITRIGGATAITGTLPDTNINNASLDNVTGLPAAIATGKVLQVVNANYGTLTNSTTSTWSDTGLTASITPSSASNKILVFANMIGLSKNGADTYMGLRLLRGASEIFLFETQAGYTAGSGFNSWGSDALNYLDSPSTTSSTTYKVQFRNVPATGTVTVNDGSGLNGSTITLMEIAV